LSRGYSHGNPAEACYKEEDKGYYQGQTVLELCHAHIQLEVLDYPCASKEEKPSENPGENYFSAADFFTCI